MCATSGLSRKDIMQSFCIKHVNQIVLIAVVAASFSPIFTKFTVAPPMAIGFYRLSVAMPIFAILTIGKYGGELRKITKGQLAGAALAGFLLAGHFFTWFTAIRHTNVASASTLAITHPIMVLLIVAIFSHKVPNWKAVAGVLVAFLGSVLISGTDYAISSEALFGDLMALGAAFFQGVYFLTGNKYRKNINASIYVFLVFFFCWLAFLIGMLATGTKFTGYPTSDYFWMAVMGVVNQIGAHALFNWCLGYVSALYVATLENLEGFISTIAAFIIFAEIPTIWQVIGGVIIVAGVIYYSKHEEESSV